MSCPLFAEDIGHAHADDADVREVDRTERSRCYSDQRDRSIPEGVVVQTGEEVGSPRRVADSDRKKAGTVVVESSHLRTLPVVAVAGSLELPQNSIPHRSRHTRVVVVGTWCVLFKNGDAFEDTQEED